MALDNIPGAEYTEATSTRHVAAIRGIENVTALDSFTFQCVYNLLNSGRVRSNKEQYYWGELTLTHFAVCLYLKIQSYDVREYHMPCHEQMLSVRV